MQTRHFENLSDKRLLNRSNSILNRLFSNGVHSIRQLARNDSEAKSIYRFLQNDNASESDIIENMVSNCKRAVGSKSVLCIQDTSSINLYNHRNRLRKDGTIGSMHNKSHRSGGLGFFMHPSFVIDSNTLVPYGFSDISLYNREIDQPNKGRNHHIRLIPLEKRESYRWIKSSLNTKQALDQAKEIIIIQDREGDFYEQFCVVPDKRTHLLIRSKANRIVNQKEKLFEHLSNTPVRGTYTTKVEGDNRRRTQTRTAKMEVRFSNITINGNQYTNKNLPEKISLYAIEVKEVNKDVDKPIHWRLLTTKKVEDIETALLCIE